MTRQDNRDHIDSPKRQPKPAPAVDENSDEPTELTFQELEARIAPTITVRKAGGTQMEY